jgi:putative SOS response-associated peptidase YedK
MCGRYATSRTAADLSALFDAVDETDDTLVPDYNVAPTDPVPLVRESASQGQRVLQSARWGLLPHWAKDAKAGAKMINARAETVATARAFAQSFALRRCLIPADGWYEWRKGEGGRKQPYFMTPSDGSVLAFAGIWSPWRPPGATESVLTCSVITTAAAGELTLIHDRMPYALPLRRWAQWLTGPADAELLLPPLTDRDVEHLELRPVGAAVGDVRNDGPQLTARVTAAPLSSAETLF